MQISRYTTDDGQERIIIDVGVDEVHSGSINPRTHGVFFKLIKMPSIENVVEYESAFKWRSPGDFIKTPTEMRPSVYKITPPKYGKHAWYTGR